MDLLRVERNPTLLCFLGAHPKRQRLDPSLAPKLM